MIYIVLNEYNFNGEHNIQIVGTYNSKEQAIEKLKEYALKSISEYGKAESFELDYDYAYLVFKSDMYEEYWISEVPLYNDNPNYKS